jgi:hypothetical protein
MEITRIASIPFSAKSDWVSSIEGSAPAQGA